MNDITSNKSERNLSQSDNYSKFWIDNALSQHVDCIMAVQAMNMIGAGLSDQAHYNYYRHAISKGKRYGKWAKLTENTQEALILKVLMAYYHINMDDARMYREILENKKTLGVVLKKAKALVTDEFLKGVTKNIKEQKTFKKQALEW